MRRGLMPREERDPSIPGWTKQALVDAGGLSPKTFDTIRKAARVRGPTHGGLGHVFSAEDVMALVHRAESGRFSERGGVPAKAWRGLLAEAGIEVPPTISTRRR